jgi:hypothetical protein
MKAGNSQVLHDITFPSKIVGDCRHGLCAKTELPAPAIIPESIRTEAREERQGGSGHPTYATALCGTFFFATFATFCSIPLHFHFIAHFCAKLPPRRRRQPRSAAGLIPDVAVVHAPRRAGLLAAQPTALRGFFRGGSLILRANSDRVRDANQSARLTEAAVLGIGIPTRPN